MGSFEGGRFSIAHGIGEVKYRVMGNENGSLYKARKTLPTWLSKG